MRMKTSSHIDHKHLQIARYALDAEWLPIDRVMRALIAVGRDKEGDVFDVWRVVGGLTDARVREALVHTDELSSAALVPDERFDTFMTLPTYVLNQQRERRTQFERDPTQMVEARVSITQELLAAERQDRVAAKISVEAPLDMIAAQIKASQASASSLDEATDYYSVPGVSAEDAAPDYYDIPEADEAQTYDSSPELIQPDEPSDPFAERYVLGRMLGQGGGGHVVRAYDRVLGRCVAMKILKNRSGSTDDLTRFIAEAQTTGQLEHPGIVPIYDFGTLDNGQVYYTMREVRNTSLRMVLRGLQQRDPDIIGEYSLIRLVGVLRSICQAIHYAHVRGVVHRDIKPDNIMIGDYGEVLIMDWGLARLFDRGSIVREEHMREEGQTLGTPAYMPPEQARGELDRVGARSDVYSLGALLYEFLTTHPPYSGETPLAIMWQVVEGKLTPPRQRAPDREIPEELERICLRAMAHRQDLRFASAKELHDALNDWLEGLQPREAQRRVVDGQAWGQRYRMLLKEADSLERRVRREASHVEDWAPLEQKRALWKLEDRLEQFRIENSSAFGLAVTNFTQALAHQPDNRAAKRGLADLYWARYEQAEAQQDHLNAIYFKALVGQYDEQGRYADFFADEVSLELMITPAPTQTRIARVDEADRRVVEVFECLRTDAPRVRTRLDAGSYVVEATFDDRPSMIVPLSMRRGQPLTLSLRAPSATQCHPGFIYIPEGPYIQGGDPACFDPRPRKNAYLDGFFCAELPVTFREYLAWIDWLQERDPELARQRAPHLRGSEGYLANFDPEQRRWVPDPILIEGPARELYPEGEGHEWELPVVGISAYDAEAYCRWRGERDAVPYRLPSVDEYEKVARGVDGRIFPWGDRFDATFCKMRASRGAIPQLEPVGTFAADVSPYGVRDLAGGVREWCLDDDEIEADRPVRGGAWSQDERSCRAASRMSILTVARIAAVGFRLVYDLPGEPA